MRFLDALCVCIYVFGLVCLCVQLGKPQRTYGSLLHCFLLYSFELGFLTVLVRLGGYLVLGTCFVFSPVSPGAAGMHADFHRGASGLNSDSHA